MLAAIHRAALAPTVHIDGKDVHKEVAALGVQMMQHSVFHGGFEMQQSGSAASSSHGLAFKYGHHQCGDASAGLSSPNSKMSEFPSNAFLMKIVLYIM